MKKKILIIGHKGYVGTILVRYLNEFKEYKKSVFGIDTNLFSLNNYNKHNKYSISIVEKLN